MIAVHYFASVREALGREQDKLELPEGINTVDQLIAYLVDKNGSVWAESLNAKSLMIAVNHEVADRGASLAEGDEVAFFPPVTGG